MISRTLNTLFMRQACRTISAVSRYQFAGCSSKKNKPIVDENNKPKVHVDGTASEFFGRKPTIEEIQKLLSPEGFLTDISFKEYDGVTPIGKFEQLQPQQKKEDMTEEEKKKDYLENNLNEWGMPEEVGFKVKGPEPTRFGDWERKGRVTDF